MAATVRSLRTPAALLQSCWPSHSPLDTLSTLLPQGLCTAIESGTHFLPVHLVHSRSQFPSHQKGFFSENLTQNKLYLRSTTK